MEKVWDELKKIDSQAEQIRIQAQDDAKEITQLAQKEAEALVSNGRTYGEKENHALYDAAVAESNKIQEQKLKESQQATEELNKKAIQKMEKAASAIVSAVLGES